MSAAQRQVLDEVFRAAVAAAHPSGCLLPHLPPPPRGRLVVLAAGKAAGSMAEIAEGYYARCDIEGMPVPEHVRDFFDRHSRAIAPRRC